MKIRTFFLRRSEGLSTCPAPPALDYDGNINVRAVAKQKV